MRVDNWKKKLRYNPVRTWYKRAPRVFRQYSVVWVQGYGPGDDNGASRSVDGDRGSPVTVPNDGTTVATGAGNADPGYHRTRTCRAGIKENQGESRTRVVLRHMEKSTAMAAHRRPYRHRCQDGMTSERSASPTRPSARPVLNAPQVRSPDGRHFEQFLSLCSVSCAHVQADDPVRALAKPSQPAKTFLLF